MKSLVIETEQEYATAIAELDTLMDAAPGSDEETRLVELAIAIGEYEKERYPMAGPPLWWRICNSLRKLRSK